MRLDRALVERGLARSRTLAQEMISDGAVLVNGTAVTRASTDVNDADVVALSSDDHGKYVSRAALKLVGALEECLPRGLRVAGRRAADAGASTGGFTQVLLENGVESVVAFDVGHDQMAPQLRQDPRVMSLEGVNVRELHEDSVGAGVDLVVGDLSFISLKLAIEPLLRFSAPSVDMLLMVKPQFEVGKQRLGRGGVVRNHADRIDAVQGVVAHMVENGLVIHHVARSPLPGPSGNEEFFVWSSRSWQASVTGERPVLVDADITRAITRAVEGNR